LLIIKKALSPDKAFSYGSRDWITI